MMKISRLDNESSQALETFVRKYADSSMFILSNMQKAGLDFTNKDFSGQYWGAWDGHALCGALVHYWNGNIVIQAPDMNILHELVTCFAAARARDIGGVIGPDTQAQTVIDMLDISPAKFAINKAEGLYALDLSAMIMPDTENFSLCLPADLIRNCYSTG